MVGDNEDLLPSSVEEPAFQAVAPNPDRLSRASLEEGTLSQRKIIRFSAAPATLLLGTAAAIAWAIHLS
ncbi:hypothetical protein WJX64_00365 [Leifsonia sp. YIM 134122]|uniref:Uncharacterized protein n=1 Tax=Leifsonia stereocauli TaxID=3134136 RepID=A0ABU9VZ28_9MICO